MSGSGSTTPSNSAAADRIRRGKGGVLRLPQMLGVSQHDPELRGRSDLESVTVSSPRALGGRRQRQNSNSPGSFATASEQLGIGRAGRETNLAWAGADACPAGLRHSPRAVQARRASPAKELPVAFGSRLISLYPVIVARSPVERNSKPFVSAMKLIVSPAATVTVRLNGSVCW